MTSPWSSDNVGGRHQEAPGNEPESGGTRKRRSARTRERIILASAEAFAANGYHGVNLSDVVVGLGLTKGALYYFFPTKEALVKEIVTCHLELFRTAGGTPLPASRNRLDEVVDLTYQVGAMFQTNAIIRAGIRLTNERNTIHCDLPRPFVFWIERLTKLLRQAKTRGELRPDISPKDTAGVIVSYFFGAQAISNELHQYRDLRPRLDRFWELTLPSLRPATTRLEATVVT